MLRIGDFSRLARVTIKALRLYDEAGLLRPTHVDPFSGYRYYDAAQLQDLDRILLLKDLGFSLQDVRRLLDDPVGLDVALRERRSALAAEIEEDRRRLRRLDCLRSALAGSPAAPPVTVKRVEPVVALTAREVVRAGDARITALFESLEADAARARARAPDSPFLLFHEGTDTEHLDVEVCIPVKPGSDGLAGVRTVEGADSAGCVVYRGGYHQTPSLFERLAEWIDAHGGRVAGPLREVYHRFGADRRGYRLPDHVVANDASEFVTELQAPLQVTTETAA